MSFLGLSLSLVSCSGSKTPPFNPLDISSLGEWWDFRTASGVGAGNPVSSLVGKKGVYTLTNTGTARPTYAADGGDGSPALLFDGVNDTLSATIDNYTLYGPTGTYEAVFVMKGLSAGAGTRGFWATNFVTMAQTFVAQTNPRIVWSTAGGVTGISGALDVQDNQWHVLRMIKNGTSRTFILDGGTPSVVTPGAGSWSSGNDTAYLGFDSSVGFWNGYIRHALFFTSTLDSTTADALTTYLQNAK